VTTIQSAVGFADLPDVVIFDECHHISAESWTKLAMSLSKATNVYGFTATAFRSDGLDVAIHSFAGPIVYRRGVQWGIQNKWLNDFSVFIIKVSPKKNGKKVFLSSDRVQATTAYKILVPSLELMTVARDRLIAALDKGRKVIVVFKTVEACKSFRKFCSDKIALDVASAEKGQKSKAPMRRFQKGESNVLLVNSGLIAEGVDIPNCDMVIQCCQNSSDVMSLQILGRIIRKKPDGAKKSIVIDIITNGYDQFERSGKKRTDLYASIIGTDNVKIIEME
jgi:superfamily II DNA or RNA helicase